MNHQPMYYFLTSSRAFILYLVFTLNTIYYVSDAGLNPLQLVLVGTILELTVFVFEIPTGLIADYFGRKKSIVFGLFIIGLAHLLEGSYPTFWAIAIAAFIWGVGWTFISGAEEAWIADELNNQQLDKVFLKGAKLSSLASFVGIIVSVLLAKFLSVQSTILIAGCLFIVSSTVVSILMRETKFVKAKESSIKRHITNSLKGNFHQIKDNPTLKLLAVVTFVIGLGSEGFDRLWGAHFITTFQLDEEQSIYWFGAFFAVAFVMNVIILKGLERINKNYYSIILISINSLLFFMMLGFAFTNHFIIAIAFYWLIEGLRNVNYPLISVMTNERLQSEGRATALSMFGQLDAIGQLIGGPIIGMIALYTSISGGIAATALFILPTIFIFWLFRKYL